MFSSYRHGLVEPATSAADLESVDWFDSELSLGNAFYSRTSMLALSDMLNRAADSERTEQERGRRRESRRRLLQQLSQSPHRYMVSNVTSHVEIIYLIIYILVIYVRCKMNL